jgi:uncharacterized damage-inducible protein DinB
MSSITRDMSVLLARELEGFERELDLFPDDESVWRTAPGVTNSAGNLALHVAGNLQHFVGAVLGGTGYKRDRDAEFNRRSGSRPGIIAELHAARAAVEKTLAGLTPDRLEAEYPQAVGNVKMRTRLFLMHLCSHAALHLGQAGYLRRALTGDGTSSNPVPVGPLGTP